MGIQKWISTNFKRSRVLTSALFEISTAEVVFCTDQQCKMVKSKDVCFNQLFQMGKKELFFHFCNTPAVQITKSKFHDFLGAENQFLSKMDFENWLEVLFNSKHLFPKFQVCLFFAVQNGQSSAENEKGVW